MILFGHLLNSLSSVVSQLSKQPFSLMIAKLCTHQRTFKQSTNLKTQHNQLSYILTYDQYGLKVSSHTLWPVTQKNTINFFLPGSGLNLTFIWQGIFLPCTQHAGLNLFLVVSSSVHHNSISMWPCIYNGKMDKNQSEDSKTQQRSAKQLAKRPRSHQAS